MRHVRLTFGDGQAFVLAAVVASGCGGAGESGAHPAGAGSPGANGGSSNAASAKGGAASTNQSGGATFGGAVGQGGKSGSIVLPAGGAATSYRTLCRQPPDDLAWSDCEQAPTSVPANYPFSIPPRQIPDTCDWQQFIVPVPREGIPPALSEICGYTDLNPSSLVARVTLTDVDVRLGTAMGRVTLAKGLGVTADTVEEIHIYVLESDAGFGTITIGTFSRDGDDFVFPISFAQRSGYTTHFPRLVLDTRLVLRCDPTRTKAVRSTTAIYQCESPDNSPVWISSGDACGECAVICEMAASPIVPPTDSHGEPLLHAVRPQVVQIGQYAGAILLQAQHDGGPDRFAYAWDVSGGQILWQDKDLLLWQPPALPAESHVQIALMAEDAAAVASCRLRTQPLRPV